MLHSVLLIEPKLNCTGSFADEVYDYLNGTSYGPGSFISDYPLDVTFGEAGFKPVDCATGALIP